MVVIKQKSKKLSKEEITSFIENINKISDEEITEWLKAVKENGLDDEETSVLCSALTKSGTILNWGDIEPTIDKHSSGGIGDKITLLFVPLMAAYGTYIPKLSGRSLGITGGTIDKLESISGLKTNLTIDEIKNQVRDIGLAIASASKELAPAEKKLYAIRDVTNTIDSIPLISASIMSKKIAGGSNNIILDVKAGTGAFMKTIEDATELAKKMVAIGKNLDRNIKALVTEMNQPLGHKIGNSLEIQEVLEVLSGKEVGDLTELVISLATEAVTILYPSKERMLEEKLRRMLLGGDALKKFEDMISSQGGSLEKGFKKSNHLEIVKSQSSGIIHNIDALAVGTVVFNLGAGRKAVTDTIDHAVGIVLLKKAGDKVNQDEPIFEIHSKSKDDAILYKDNLLGAIKIGQNSPPKLKLVHEIIK